MNASDVSVKRVAGEVVLLLHLPANPTCPLSGVYLSPEEARILARDVLAAAEELQPLTVPHEGECPACNGAGSVWAAPEWDDCDVCHGTGKVTDGPLAVEGGTLTLGGE
jgi:hypothetical protein